MSEKEEEDLNKYFEKAKRKHGSLKQFISLSKPVDVVKKDLSISLEIDKNKTDNNKSLF